MKVSPYHFIGIGGIGMSGLARLLLQQRIPVSGSDLSNSDIVENLKGLGAKISIGHASQNVPPGVTVVVSSGINGQNPEILQARDSQLPILHRSDLLQRLMQDKKSLLVAGTHGKTTTTSLLTSVLLKANWDPSYAIGGILAETGCNAGQGLSEYFIAEADESDGTFIKYAPYGAIITNIDNDHMDHFGSSEALIKGFKTFWERTSSSHHLFYCGEDIYLNQINLPGISYGFTPGCVLKGLHFQQQGWEICFDVSFEGQFYSQVKANLIGYHNALNALAVFGLCLKLGIPENIIREALNSFQGVKRRAEKKGEIHQVLIMDDYGHHPTEIKTTLNGIKKAMADRRVIALFQPHRYSRTRDCLADFGACFEGADEVIVTDIYGAGEEPIVGVHAKNVLEQIHNNSLVPARYVSKSHLLDELISTVRPFDVLVTVGAGDIYKTGMTLLEKLSTTAPTKYRLGLIFGGKSTEHEISLLSAKNIAKALDTSALDVVYFYISKEGYWSVVETIEEKKADQQLDADTLKALQLCDVVFPILHGPMGEDGTIQGFFKMLDIAYVGCDHQSSAICMDKAVTKKMAMAAGIRVAPFVDFSTYAWKCNQDYYLNEIETRLSYPLYIKPVHLGSTIGVRKAMNLNELRESIANALRYDHHVIVENEIRGREIEFSVMGREKIVTFAPGEIFTAGAVYGYEEKYGAAAFKTTPQAHLSPELIDQGMAFASAAYQSCGCDGYARVDCFLDEDGQYLLNEINPIPGFTSNSLFPKMCEVQGLGLTKLLNKLIGLGLARKRSNARLISHMNI